MKDDRGNRLETLLQQAMKDDLPKELELRLERKMQNFFADKIEDAGSSVPDFSFLNPWFEWMAQPAVSYALTAIVFACLITSSMVMHLTEHKNALATTIDTIHLTAKVFAAIEDAQYMFVKEQRIEGEDGVVSNWIGWAAGVSRIEFGGDETEKETWIITQNKTEIQHPGKEETVIEPLHETAALFASPERIRNQLMGKWKVMQGKIKDSTKPVEVTIENMREGYQIKLWVDSQTNLPVRIETQAAELPGGGTLEWKKIQMDLEWNQPVDGDQIIQNDE